MDYLITNKLTKKQVLLNTKDTVQFFKFNSVENYTISKNNKKSLLLNVLEWSFIVAFILFVTICVIENLPQ